MAVRALLLIALLALICATQTSSGEPTTMVKRVRIDQLPMQSADWVLNPYWEEYLVLNHYIYLYRSVLPRLTEYSVTPGPLQRRLASQTSRVLRERLARQGSGDPLLLNKALGMRERDSSRVAGFRFRASPYFQELDARGENPVHRVGVNAETWLLSGAYWQVYVRGRLENKGELYPQFSGRIWKDKITGWFDNAAVYFYKDGFFGSFGRSYIVWGPEQHDALLISDNSPPFDRLWLGYENKIFRFDYLVTRLDNAVSNDSVMVRYLAAHRLSFRKTGWFELGLSEVVLFGGYNRPIDWHYLNPFLSYYWEQWNDRTNDNILFGADLVVYWPRRARIFSELLVDDFQIDFSSEPQQVGYKIGLDAVEPFNVRRIFTKLSYTRVNTTVYGQDRPQNLYLHDGQPIGYFGGNDLDRWLALLRYHLSATFDLEVELQYNRKGEDRIELQPNAVPHGLGFPSGVVEKSRSVSARLFFLTKEFLTGHCQVSYTHDENYRHREGESRTRLGVDFLISWYLSGCIQ
jgi:hypothetical protein